MQCIPCATNSQRLAICTQIKFSAPMPCQADGDVPSKPWVQSRTTWAVSQQFGVDDVSSFQTGVQGLEKGEQREHVEINSIGSGCNGMN